MIEAEVIAYHGWGFDASCWEGWKEVLPSSFDLQCFDRGYFGSPIQPVFSIQTSFKIIMTHSFGLHLCPKNKLEVADLLIIFGGFLDFHPRDNTQHRRSQLILQAMLRQLKTSPFTVLNKFYQNVFTPEKSAHEPPAKINEKKLHADLKVLGQHKMGHLKLKRTAKIAILHGVKDHIVPHAKGKHLYELNKHRARYFLFREAGHALPFTHKEECWSHIKTLLMMQQGKYF